MERLKLNKKGKIVDVMLHPVFVLVVALGVVGLILINTTTEIGSDTTYEQKYYSADAALIIDSLFALRRDVNLQYTYLLPQNLGLKIEDYKATVYTDLKPEGNSFYFTMDSNYQPIIPTKIPPGKTPILYKNDKKIGITDKKINYEQNIICDEELPKIKTDFQVTKEKIGQIPTKILGAEPTIYASVKKGSPQLVIYTNNKGYSNILACKIAQGIGKGINFEGFSIVPLSSLLIKDEITKNLVENENPAIYLEIQQENIQGISEVVLDISERTVNPGQSI